MMCREEEIRRHLSPRLAASPGTNSRRCWQRLEFSLYWATRYGRTHLYASVVE